MSNMVIFVGGFALSLVVYGLWAHLVWWDHLKNQARSKADALLLVPHTFRLVTIGRQPGDMPASRFLPEIVLTPPSHHLITRLLVDLRHRLEYAALRLLAAVIRALPLAVAGDNPAAVYRSVRSLNCESPSRAPPVEG